MKTTVEKKAGCEAVLTGTIPSADVRKEFPKSLDRAVRLVELPGFRKGKVPKERVLQEVGEKSIWRDAAEDVLRDQLADIVKEHSLVPIIPPAITLKASEPDEDVSFTVVLVTPPTLEIKDYKGAAATALTKLEKLDEKKELSEARKSLDGQVKAMLQKTDDAALTDDEAKKVGFENMKALEHFLETEAERAVENYDNQRKRGAVAEALLAASTFDIPAVIVEDEARAMLESTKAEIARQLPFNEYLEKRGMTEEQVRDEMKPQATKRVALDMLFAKIAGEEKLTPDDAETHRIAHALMQQGAPEDRAHQYGAEMSVREKIWVILGVSAPVKPTPPEAETAVTETNPDTHEHHESGEHDHVH